jgi:hypothetical protein
VSIQPSARPAPATRPEEAAAEKSAHGLRERGYAASVGQRGETVILGPWSAESLLLRLAALEAEVADLRKPPY